MDRAETSGAPRSDSESTVLVPTLPQTSNISSSPLIPEWPTIDGPLGLSGEDSIGYARRFFKFGFCLLPFLWALNCFYFWPVLRCPASFPRTRPYVVRSAVGFGVFAALLSAWVLTFTIGGERLFGHVWNELVMYNVAEKYGLTGLV